MKLINSYPAWDRELLGGRRGAELVLILCAVNPTNPARDTCRPLAIGIRTGSATPFRHVHAMDERS
jgi:hypothetical protein